MTSNNLNDDRFSYLFDIALSGTDLSGPQFSSDELNELISIRKLLDIVDQAWEVTQDENDRMQKLLLEKLAVNYPDHPWLKVTVHTLGELIKIENDDLPKLPEKSYEQLSKDSTLVETLKDPKTRTVIIGQIIRKAEVPPTLIVDFMKWLNNALNNLVQKPGNQGLVYRRSQGKPRAEK